MAQNGRDFHLPDEILSVIPTDPYDQLDLARKITSMAIASRVSKLESETGRLQHTISEKDRTIADLQQQVSDLDRMFQESQARFRIALEENAKLVKERDLLALATKKLGKDLAKLETFKRQLKQSLGEDTSASQPAESVDIETYDLSNLRISQKDHEPISRQGSDPVSGSVEIGVPVQDEPESAAHSFSVSSYITPRLSPVGTPKVASTAASPKGFSTAGSSPRFWSGSTSPTKSRFEGNSSLSLTSSSSQQSSTPSTPPQGRPPRIDGKEFFRQARSRLSYEQFGAFLANIKELNAHRQSREETLQKAEEILGIDNKDLYISFQRLLNRNQS